MTKESNLNREAITLRVDRTRPNGPHAFPPTRHLRDQFRKHVLKTSQPESFLGVSLEKPDRSESFELVSPFHVSENQRPACERVPCSNCSDGKPKFLKGDALLSADGHIYLVGSCCGPKYFGIDRYRRAEKARSSRIEQENNEDFLLDNVGKVPKLMEVIRLLIPVAEACRKQHVKFKKGAPLLFEELNQQNKQNSGMLTITRRISGSGPGGMRSSTGNTSNEMQENVARLQGVSALRKTLNLDQKLRTNLRMLETYSLGTTPSSDITEDMILELVVGLTETSRGALVKLIKTSSKDTHYSISTFQDFHKFFDHENCVEISRWGTHPENSIGVAMSRNGDVCRVISEREGTVQLFMDRLTRVPSILPPAFE